MLMSILTLHAGALAAQDLTAELDKLFSWAGPTTPGCAVAASRDGALVIDRVWGMANLEKQIPFTTATILDAGSVQKQFVAAAVLTLVQDGRIRLDDDIRKHIPELPDLGRVITVDHLLTHTSGLRDWTGLLQFSRDDVDALTLILRQHGLNFAPGEEWSYSNSGYVLLKEVVGRVAGRPFADVARDRLFTPLGMTSTVYAYDGLVGNDRLAMAYQEKGDAWVPGVLEGNERGGGGALFTTARDLLTWNHALADSALGTFVTAKLQEPARLNNGRKLDYGRGLVLDVIGGAEAVWHSGSAGAYKTVTGIFPAYGVSLAIMCNAGDTKGGFAPRIRRLLAPESVEAPSPPVAVVDSAGAAAFDPTGRDGLWLDEAGGEPLRILAQGGGLRLDRGPPLVPVAADRLRPIEPLLQFRSGDAFELRFTAADEITLTSMEGTVTRYRRAQPVAATPETLQQLVGRYANEELNAVFTVALGDNGLTIRLNDSRPFPLSPVAAETYQLNRMLMRFVRDADGQVTALDHSNPVLRGVRFERSER
jgi:CubicO group peptidase (beta-lactamase class C family)